MDLELEEDYLEEDIQEVFGDEENNVNKSIELKEKITAPSMSIYEKVSFIEQRVEQLNNNYKTTVPNEVKQKNITKSIDIALLEYDMKALPKLYIYRRFPNGTFEKWEFNEFEFYP